jgi:hypothetical protein
LLNDLPAFREKHQQAYQMSAVPELRWNSGFVSSCDGDMQSRDETLLVCYEISVVRLGFGQSLVASGRRDLKALLPDAVAMALLACKTFATLDVHTDRALQELKLPSDFRVPLRRELARLAELGFLVPWPDISTPVPRRTSMRIHDVAVLSRNRPDALMRTIRTHLMHAREFGRMPRVSIMDSSTDDVSREVSEKNASAAAAEFGTEIRYADNTRKINFAKRIASRAELRPDLLAFALGDSYDCGRDTGSNRNALLLAHVGRSFLSSDDDVVCEPRGTIEAGPLWRLTSKSDPTTVTLYESLAGARSEVSPASKCIFEAHESLLGRTLGELVIDLGSRGSAIEAVPGSTLRGLVDGSARIAVTSSGIVGDSGARFPGFYLWRSEVRDQLTIVSDSIYERLVSSRQIAKIVRTPTVTTGHFLMSTHLAFDQIDRPLPPFFPVMRGQDLTFGRVLRLCHAGNHIGHVPYAMIHQPVEDRLVSMSNLWPTDGTPAFANILELCLEASSPGLLNSALDRDRTRALGRALRELAALDVLEFESIVRTKLIEKTANRVVEQGRQLDALSNTTAWSRDLERLRNQTILRWQDDIPVAASELVASRGTIEGARLTRNLIAAYGELLESWSDITTAAKDLENRGQGLFEPAVG